MKTALQSAIDAIKETAKTYPVGSMENGILLVTAAKIQLLIPVEEHQLNDAWNKGYQAGRSLPRGRKQ